MMTFSMKAECYDVLSVVYAECHAYKPLILNVIMLNVFILVCHGALESKTGACNIKLFTELGAYH
jgi:hypothetical protein